MASTQADAGFQRGIAASASVARHAANAILLAGLESIHSRLVVSRTSFNRIVLGFVWPAVCNVLAILLVGGESTPVKFRIPHAYSDLEMVSVIPVNVSLVIMLLKENLYPTMGYQHMKLQLYGEVSHSGQTPIYQRLFLGASKKEVQSKGSTTPQELRTLWVFKSSTSTHARSGLGGSQAISTFQQPPASCTNPLSLKQITVLSAASVLQAFAPAASDSPALAPTPIQHLTERPLRTLGTWMTTKSPGERV
ncbi:uncharacterized protein LY79DRAFT_577436 [Colletotrichum navitas]|uniref:Uncharacterized protein n=1 Tax=Colletotrichum navitas TaxID=681940 RepID=A0AAD8Q5W8_9PEZI|nr:uncharacterized protein LY79DRAFT_577436 [Colletotrichum navitas]KAK1596422.1 hypothetical protein LY79DRAFT_577436 [Colletotrichum navitas]